MHPEHHHHMWHTSVTSREQCALVCDCGCKSSHQQVQFLFTMAENSPYTLPAFFARAGPAANRTRSKTGGGNSKRPRPEKAAKEVVTTPSQAQLDRGMEDNDFAVKKQKLICAPATRDDRARERVTGERSVKGSTKAFEISKKISARILHDYPDVYEWKTDRNKNKFLQCKYCFDVLDDQVKCTPSKIDRHVACPSHKEAVAAWQRQEAKKKVMFSALKATPSSKITLADDESIFRGATVSAFLSAGINLNKLTLLRPYLEHYCNAKLDDVSNLKKVYLPRLRLVRLNEIKAAIKAGAQIVVIHDGTNRHSEFYCVVVRWCDSAFNLQERLVALKAYRGAQKGHELALMLTEILNSLELPMGEVLEDGSYSAGGLLAVMRDRASVNQKCANVMKLMWINYMDLECISHTFSKVGEKMALTCLTTFRDELLIALNSQAFKAHVRRFLPTPPRKPSATRWWSTWELYDFLLKRDDAPGSPSNFEKLLTACREALNADGDVAVDGVFEDSVRVRRLHDFAQNATRVENVSLELAVVVEVFRPFVQATYALEGAGCCVLEVSHWFRRLASFWRTFEPSLAFLNVRERIESIAAARVVRGMSDHATARLALETRVRELINPVTEQLSYVFDGSSGELRSDVLFYSFVASLNPYEHGHPDVAPLIRPEIFKQEVLKHFPGRFEVAQVDSMVQELPDFGLACAAFIANNAAAAPDGNPDNTAVHRNKAIWNFWRGLDANNVCPHLRRLAQLTLSIVPSSAAAERCFSLLKAFFDSQQLVGDRRGALEDYIEQTIAMSFEENNKNNAFHQ